jgi:hypothetical protein
MHPRPRALAHDRTVHLFFPARPGRAAHVPSLERRDEFAALVVPFLTVNAPEHDAR